MMDAEAINFISSVGYPIFISLWFMFRMEKVINKNTEAINNMSSMIKGAKL